MGTEVIRFTQIGLEDIRIGDETFEVVLADGRKVVLNALNLHNFLAAYNAQISWDSTNKRLGIRTTTPARPLDLVKEDNNGTPQLRLTGTATRYAELRAGSDGADDGDFYLTQTGSTVWLQSLTDTYRLTLELVPKGVVTHAPATMEMYGTDYIADSVNYERLSLRTRGTTDSYHEISSEKGGGGTVRSVLISAGSNHLWLDATSGSVGIGTQTVTGCQPGNVTLLPILFANLGTPIDGTIAYCSNCTTTNPCASGGDGALAKRLNGVWVCN